jgi:hypothetical protein
VTSGLPAPSPTGGFSIDSIDDLLEKVRIVDECLRDLATARFWLGEITKRPVTEAFSTLPPLVSVAVPYVNACAATVAVIDQAEVKLVGMADALRAYVTSMQVQDQAALDALAGLEAKIDAALAPTPVPVPERQADGRIAKAHRHQQPI